MWMADASCIYMLYLYILCIQPHSVHDCACGKYNDEQIAARYIHSSIVSPVSLLYVYQEFVGLGLFEALYIWYMFAFADIRLGYL